MSTRFAPHRSNGRSLGLAALLTLIAFSASADAAPAPKKSGKPPAERAEPKQGASEARRDTPAPAPNADRPAADQQVPQSGPTGDAQPQMGGVAPSQERSGPERGMGDMSRPDSVQTRPAGASSPSQGGSPDSHGRAGADRDSSSSSSAPDRGGSSSSSASGGGSSGAPPSDSAHGSGGSGRTPSSASSRGGSSHASASGHGSGHPSGTTRSYERSSSHDRHTPSYQSRDHRYGHPSPQYVRSHPHAHRPPPSHAYYRSYYVNYWVHPYYRYQHTSSVVVTFGFAVSPWVVSWAPPPRAGWSWSVGWYDAWGYYHPGYWAPVGPAPVYRGVSYVYVPGWWDNNTYIEGYYRPDARSGWSWVDGYYVADGGYVPGHWQPRSRAPEGYVWQPGFYDGEQWVEGFWRPEQRAGYAWVNGYFDEDGIYSSGYWMPTQERAGQVWIPGWFDGNQWVEGYWVSESEYYNADVQGWEPEQGYDDGWQESPKSSSPTRSTPDNARTTVAERGSEESSASTEDEVPLAIPVEVQEEEIR